MEQVLLPNKIGIVNWALASISNDAANQIVATFLDWSQQVVTDANNIDPLSITIDIEWNAVPLILKKAINNIERSLYELFHNNYYHRILYAGLVGELTKHKVLSLDYKSAAVQKIVQHMSDKIIKEYQDSVKSFSNATDQDKDITSLAFALLDYRLQLIQDQWVDMLQYKDSIYEIKKFMYTELLQYRVDKLSEEWSMQDVYNDMSTCKNIYETILDAEKNHVDVVATKQIFITKAQRIYHKGLATLMAYYKTSNKLAWFQDLYQKYQDARDMQLDVEKFSQEMEQLWVAIYNKLLPLEIEKLYTSWHWYWSYKIVKSYVEWAKKFNVSNTDIENELAEIWKKKLVHIIQSSFDNLINPDNVEPLQHYNALLWFIQEAKDLWIDVSMFDEQLRQLKLLNIYYDEPISN